MYVFDGIASIKVVQFHKSSHLMEVGYNTGERKNRRNNKVRIWSIIIEKSNSDYSLAIVT